MDPPRLRMGESRSPGKVWAFAVGPFGLITVTSPDDDPEATELWFTPDGVESTSFNVADLFGPGAVADGFAVGAGSIVAVISTFDESADYPWIAKFGSASPRGSSRAIPE